MLMLSFSKIHLAFRWTTSWSTSRRRRQASWWASTAAAMPRPRRSCKSTRNDVERDSLSARSRARKCSDQIISHFWSKIFVPSFLSLLLWLSPFLFFPFLQTIRNLSPVSLWHTLNFVFLSLNRWTHCLIWYFGKFGNNTRWMNAGICFCRAH